MKSYDVVTCTSTRLAAAIVVAALGLGTGSAAAAQETAPPEAMASAGGEVISKVTEEKHVPIAALDNDTVLIKNDPSDFTQRWYYPPFVVPDWMEFDARVTRACSAKPDGIQTVLMPVRFESLRVIRDIERQMKLDPKTNEGHLHPYEVANIRLEWDAPGTTTNLVLRDREGPFQTYGSFVSNGEFPVELTCAQLESFVASKQIEARMTILEADVERNIVIAEAKATALAELRLTLNRSVQENDTLSIAAHQYGTQSQASIPTIAVAAIGYTGAGTEAKRDQRRFVSANVLKSIVDSSQLTVAIRRYCVSARCDGLSPILSPKDLVDLGKVVEAEIKSEKSGDWKLIIDQYEHEITPHEEALILASAPKARQFMHGTLDLPCGTDGALKCSVDNEVETTMEHPMLWRKKGANIRPVSIKLVAFDTTEIEREWRSVNEIVDRKQVRLVTYPIQVKALQSVTELDWVELSSNVMAPIRTAKCNTPDGGRGGSIVANAIVAKGFACDQPIVATLSVEPGTAQKWKIDPVVTLCKANEVECDAVIDMSRERDKGVWIGATDIEKPTEVRLRYGDDGQALPLMFVKPSHAESCELRGIGGSYGLLVRPIIFRTTRHPSDGCTPAAAAAPTAGASD